MPFDPDIVVTQRDSCAPLLIAEAKLQHEDVDGAESQLKKYMWEMSCPVGLLVFPDNLFVYRNNFTGYSDDSVRRFGPFKTPEYWRAFEHNESESAFDRTVQHWLERIQFNIGAADVPMPTRAALSEHVLPSLINGEIHAARRRTFT